MEKDAALKIIEQLAHGVDPHTGEVFAADSTYQHPDTVRALHFALRELQAQPVAKRAAAGENAPQNAGKPWSDDEDQALVAAFDAGGRIPELAIEHRRSRFAIEARLAKLGKIAPPANLRGNKVAAAPVAYSVHH